MGKISPRVYVHEVIRGSTLQFRDMQPSDVDAIVPYWRDRPDEKLRILGVDRAVIGTESEIKGRLLKLVRSDDPRQDRLGFVFDLDGEIIGYLNIHIVGEGRAYAHIHFIADHARGKGLGSLVLIRVARALMPAHNISLFLLQTRPSNPAINKLLDHVFKLKPELRYVADPDGGLASPGELCCYELSLSHVNSIDDPLAMMHERALP